jgi:hypothetical protein
MYGLPIYHAANWILLGKTTGRGKQSNSNVPNRSIKEILRYSEAEGEGLKAGDPDV